MKTKIQGLLRHRTGIYYARLYIGDKEKWVWLRTNLLEVAKSRFLTGENVVAIRERQVRGVPIQAAHFNFRQAKDLYLATLDHKVAVEKLKPGTRDY
jgi:hypothetical protein